MWNGSLMLKSEIRLIYDINFWHSNKGVNELVRYFSNPDKVDVDVQQNVLFVAARGP